MSKKLLAQQIAAVTAAGLLLPGFAIAQDSEKRVALEEVVVTATKREENIFNVPVAISAFAPETIEKQQIVDLVDIGKFVPNLNVTQFSAGHTSSANPFIRGIGLQDHLIATDPGERVVRRIHHLSRARRPDRRCLISLVRHLLSSR